MTQGFSFVDGDGKPFDPITGHVRMHPDGSCVWGAVRGAVLVRVIVEFL